MANVSFFSSGTKTEIINIKGDGLCFFRSIATALAMDTKNTNIEEGITALKLAIIDEINNNVHKYQSTFRDLISIYEAGSLDSDMRPFMENDEYVTKDLKSYIQYFFRTNEWANDLTIAPTIRSLDGVGIIILRKANDIFVMHNNRVCDMFVACHSFIFILYDGNHYQLVKVDDRPITSKGLMNEGIKTSLAIACSRNTERDLLTAKSVLIIGKQINDKDLDYITIRDYLKKSLIPQLTDDNRAAILAELDTDEDHLKQRMENRASELVIDIQVHYDTLEKYPTGTIHCVIANHCSRNDFMKYLPIIKRILVANGLIAFTTYTGDKHTTVIEDGNAHQNQDNENLYTMTK
jgi:hypothetical protein